MNSSEESNTAGYTVGMARTCIYYTEANRQLSFNMEHEKGAFHICVYPTPKWYSPVDYSPLGKVSALEFPAILRNMESSLNEKGFRCFFENQDGTPFDLGSI